jgi:putative protease
MHVVGALRPHVAKMRDSVVAQKVSFVPRTAVRS